MLNLLLTALLASPTTAPTPPPTLAVLPPVSARPSPLVKAPPLGAWRPAPLKDWQLQRIYLPLMLHFEATARDVKLLTPPTVKRAATLATSGRRHPDGPICARPPTTVEVLKAQHPNLFVARSHTYCTPNGRCGLSVAIDGPYAKVKAMGLDSLSAGHFKGSPDDIQGWRRAIKGLERTSGGMVVGGLMAKHGYLMVEARPELGRELSASAQLAAALATCLKGAPAQRITVSLSIDEAGHITTQPAADERTTCLKAALDELHTTCPANRQAEVLDAELVVIGRRD